MSLHTSRRNFLTQTSIAAGSLALASTALRPSLFGAATDQPFKISLAQWSLHRALKAKELDNLDFAKVAKTDYGIDAVEYVNQFFKDKANDTVYLSDMKKRASDLGVSNVLIMIDGEGSLGDADEKKRTTAVENHYKWIDAAKFLGCHSIRVNAATGEPDFKKSQKLAADGLRRVSERAQQSGINVIVENHGGLSSNGKWLSETIKQVNLPNCGTLPDFGNFIINKATGESYDRYQGVTDLMPYAKAVSAKSYDFDEAGNETLIDYAKIMTIVLKAGYHGYVGIEYEGSRLSERDGILATKKLLERCQSELAALK
ncbi:MAG: sugar phosphate isomerase/epimerase family protein [Pirellulaceae bacterium]|nr:sugar phosphate isomerase/epimerase family protein [Pirellulaceae bacterium]